MNRTSKNSKRKTILQVLLLLSIPAALFPVTAREILKSLREPDRVTITFTQTRSLKGNKENFFARGKIDYLSPYLKYEVNHPSQTVILTPDRIMISSPYMEKTEKREGLEKVSPWEIFIQEFKTGEVTLKEDSDFWILEKKKGENIFKLLISKKEKEVKRLEVSTPFETVVTEVTGIVKNPSLKKSHFKLPVNKK